MNSPAPPLVRVAWAYGDDPDLADRLLLGLLDGMAGPVRRLCPWCGSGAHGRPVLPGPPHPHLSLARAGVLVVVATCDCAPVGIDVEREDAAAASGGTLHPREAAGEAVGGPVTWVRKEALLKATGHGLRLDPTTVRVSDPGAPPELLVWPEPPIPDVWLCDVTIAPGYVAAVAVMAPGPATVVVTPAVPAAPSSTATP